ncbi:MAG: large subunit ribosomal protein L23 [Planctomycetota bacterium]|jgi:large subunit ribosomal protein L23
MALFGKNKEKEVVDEVEVEEVDTVAVNEKKTSTASKTTAKKETKKKIGTATGGDLSWVLLRPRITEKAAILGEENIYTFDVAPRSNKILIKQAIKSLYKVTPKKVHITALPKKATFTRGHKGVTGGGKKALVFLKKGDKIEF